MTRAEAKQFHIVGVVDRMRYEMFVDHIYNDLESKVCENCEHGGDDRPRTDECPLDDYYISLDEYDESTFGCTYFKRKS